MPVRGCRLDFNVVPTGVRHAGIAQTTQEELAVKDQLLIAQAVAEMDVSRAIRFLCADDAETEGIVEGGHVFRAVLPLFHLRSPIHIGDVVSVIEHRIGGF